MDKTTLISRAAALTIAIQMGSGWRAGLWRQEDEPPSLEEFLNAVHARAKELLNDVFSLKSANLEPNPFLPDGKLRCNACQSQLVVTGIAASPFLYFWGIEETPLELHFSITCELQCQETQWTCQFPANWDGGSGFSIYLSMLKPPEWEF